MIECTFELNSRKMSALVCSNGKRYSAFSGLPAYMNQPEATHLVDRGPLPKGTYYIVDRPTGGHWKWARAVVDSFWGRDEWFGLYRVDEEIDDVTYVGDVKRGAFRLHPKGYLGRSQGCITFASGEQFRQLRRHLMRAKVSFIPGTHIRTYGRVIVR